jgi:colicin import membrane protein
MGLVALLAGAVLAGAVLGVAAQSPPSALPGLPVLPSSTGSDRAAIALQRQAIEQAAQQQALACQSRFAVTACLEGVRAQQREALAPWRERELQLNEDSRRDRATARFEALQRKAQSRSAAAAGGVAKQPLEPVAPPLLPPTRAAPAPAAAPTPDTPSPRDAQRLKAAKREQQAAQRVRTGAQRAKATARAQERVKQRVAPKAKQTGQAAP